MIRRTTLFALTLFGSLAPLALQAATLEIPTDTSIKSRPTTIKVLLTKLANDATIEVKGKFRVYNPKTNQLIDSGKDKWARIVYSESGMRWGDLFPATFEMRIVPAAPESTLMVNGVPYRGCLEVYGIAGTINIVSEVDLDNYLKASLPAKINEALDQEVLDALVVVERTHLAYLAQKNAGSNWQIAADKVGYPGDSKHNAAIDASVERTRGVILNYQGNPFPAAWNRHSAGRTASYASIFRKGGSMPSGVLELPSKTTKEETKWSASVPKQLLAEITSLDQINQVELYRAEGTSKVYALRLGDGINSQDIDFEKLQNAIGYKLLKSNDFVVKVEGENILFSGFGEGAGVGLCLASAQILSEQQEDARKILLIHFPGAQLTRLSAPKDDLTAFIWK